MHKQENLMNRVPVPVFAAAKKGVLCCGRNFYSQTKKNKTIKFEQSYILLISLARDKQTVCNNCTNCSVECTVQHVHHCFRFLASN